MRKLYLDFKRKPFLLPQLLQALIKEIMDLRVRLFGKLIKATLFYIFTQKKLKLHFKFTGPVVYYMIYYPLIAIKNLTN